MRKRLIAAPLAFVGSLGLTLVTAMPASAATTGGDVDHLSGSRGYIVIWQHNGFSRYLYPGQSSYDYSGYYNDVQSFRPASGTVCRSQYSGTSYPYKGGVRYYMSQNNLNLVMWCKTSTTSAVATGTSPTDLPILAMLVRLDRLDRGKDEP